MSAANPPRPGATEGPGPLTRLERSILEALLQGEDEGHAVLRAQLAGATALSRTHSGVGFVTRIQVPDPAVSLPAGVTLRLPPVHATHPHLGEAAEFLLQLRAGRLAVLEAFCFQGGWPADEGQFRIKPR